MDQVLQLRASSRSLGPARARADLLAQQSAHAGAVAQSELSTRMGHKESRNRGHIKWRGRELLSDEPLSANWWD